MPDVFQAGDVIRLTVTLRDIDDVIGDPSTLTFRLTEPDGTAVVYEWQTDAELVRESAGVFYVDYAITQPDYHYYAFTATGTRQSYAEGRFVARARRVVAA